MGHAMLTLAAGRRGALARHLFITAGFEMF